MIDDGDRVVGLLVDAVSEIVAVTDAMRQVAPETGSAASREDVEGLPMRDQQIVSGFSIQPIMPRETMIEAELEAA